MDRMSNKVLALLMVAVLGAMACFCGGEEEEPSRWENTESTKTAPSNTGKSEKAEKPAKPAVEGSSLNAAFPASGVDGFSRTFTQEKDGFAEAKYTKDGAEIVFTISDTASNPSALTKFKTASETIQGFPSMKQGNNGTVLLVNDRFQVKATSKDVDHAGRTALLEKAKLSALPAAN